MSFQQRRFPRPHAQAGFPQPEQHNGPAVLLVDDEPAILDGLRRQLRKRFTVATATSGAAGLELLESGSFAAVVSDMRMPGMDGAAFLARVRTAYPDTVRLLLTGQADTQSAIAAINDGQIYRFLTKPCAPDLLQAALDSAVELHRLVTAEKDLLEKTLRSTVETLTATLSLAQPQAFARAVRITRTVIELAEALDLDRRWEIEITAMLSHLGAVSLPPNVLEKLDRGLPLSDDEQEMADRVPRASEELVRAIPRLEGVGRAIGLQRARYDGAGSGADTPAGEDIPVEARLLRVAVDFDAGMTPRPAAHAAIAKLGTDRGAYDPDVLDALARCYAVEERAAPARKVALLDLEPGMVLADDVLNGRGVLLVGRGTTVTDALIYRLENFSRQDGISSPILIEAPRPR
jgi:response regulator RpfG family c-di-GMP phosphodiesterase